MHHETDLSDAVDLSDAILMVDDHWGIYVPQCFANRVDTACLSGVSTLDLTILREGPDHPLYWDAWDSVLNNAALMSVDGIAYSLWQDGDLWAVPFTVIPA